MPSVGPCGVFDSMYLSPWSLRFLNQEYSSLFPEALLIFHLLGERHQQIVCSAEAIALHYKCEKVKDNINEQCTEHREVMSRRLVILRR